LTTIGVNNNTNTQQGVIAVPVHKQNTLLPRTIIGLFMALLCMAMQPVHAGWFYDVEGGFVYNDNWSRAEHSNDIEGDTALEVSGSAGRFYELEDGKSFTITGQLSGQAFADYDGLNNVRLGLNASLRKKFGLGAYTPWASIGAGVARGEFNNDIRDSWFYSVTLSAGKRLSDRWDVGGNLMYEWRDGDEHGPQKAMGPGNPIYDDLISGMGLNATSDADVYDQQAWSISLFADYSFTDKTLVSFGYSYRDGDITSTGTPSAKIITAADAIQLDKTFDNGKYAYRLDAITHSFRILVSHAVTDNASLNLGYEYQATYGDNNNDYDNNIFRANVLVSY
jgi:hypothetical protein